MKVPFFDYSRIYLDDKKLILEAIESVGQRGAYILQKDLKDFESRLAGYVGSAHATGVANATDGLEIIWKVVGIKPGDEVITQAFTFIATIEAILALGANPKIVNISSKKYIDEFGKKEFVPIDDGIEKVIEWIKNIILGGN